MDLEERLQSSSPRLRRPARDETGVLSGLPLAATRMGPFGLSLSKTAAQTSRTAALRRSPFDGLKANGVRSRGRVSPQCHCPASAADGASSGPRSVR